MIQVDADDGASVDDSKNLLLDKEESFVGGRREEQPGNRQAHEGLMISNRSMSKESPRSVA